MGMTRSVGHAASQPKGVNESSGEQIIDLDEDRKKREALEMGVCRHPICVVYIGY